MIELFSAARLPEEPGPREIVGEIAMGIVATIDEAFSADAASAGEAYDLDGYGTALN